MSDKHPSAGESPFDLCTVILVYLPVWIDKRLLVELKNGKLIFRQKPLPLDKSSETMQGTHSRIAVTKARLMVPFRNRSVPRDARDPVNTERTPARNYPGGVQTAHSEVGP